MQIDDDRTNSSLVVGTSTVDFSKKVISIFVRRFYQVY